MLYIMLHKYQVEFRSKYSTQQATITLVNNFTKCLDSECAAIVIGIFLDLTKPLTWWITIAV